MTVDQWIEREKSMTAERIRAYEKTTYYAGKWRPEYERWVQMLAGGRGLDAPIEVKGQSVCFEDALADTDLKIALLNDPGSRYH